MQPLQSFAEAFLVISPRHAVHAHRRIATQGIKALPQQLWCNVMQQCRETHAFILSCDLAYAFKRRRRIMNPALSPGCGTPVSISLGYAPSLHPLRGVALRLRLVRGFPRYYGHIRLLVRVSDRVTTHSLSCPAISRKAQTRPPSFCA